MRGERDSVVSRPNEGNTKRSGRKLLKRQQAINELVDVLVVKFPIVVEYLEKGAN